MLYYVIDMKLHPLTHLCVFISFLINSFVSVGPIYSAQAQLGLPNGADAIRLPAPGVMVGLSPAYSPAVLKGIKLDPMNPFRFHFFVDRGDSKLSVETPFMASQLKKESAKLIKYFLASLTIPEKDLWVTY